MNKILDNEFNAKILLARPKLPIQYEWMKNPNDTNSGLPLIGVEITEEWMDVECPVCKNKYELTEDHLEYNEAPIWLQVVKVGFILLGAYKLQELIWSISL